MKFFYLTLQRGEVIKTKLFISLHLVLREMTAKFIFLVGKIIVDFIYKNAVQFMSSSET